MADSRHFDSS